MNILYEEDGGFKLGSILADQTTSLQVETQHGKRSKVKAAAVLLRFAAPSMQELAEQAQAHAAAIDIDFLWQCCSAEEFSFLDLAVEYFGHTPTPAEAAAVLFRLHAAPMYFYKKGKGRYRAAPADALKAALASEERKRLQAERMAGFVAELEQGRLPADFHADLDELIYRPDKQSLPYKALERVADAAHTTPLRVLVQCGALADMEHYHRELFLREYFPHGTGFPPLEGLADVDSLPLAPVSAFSIDDAETTEIDDAFSLSRLANGDWRIGIHIAAPALLITPGSSLDQIALQRLSTVYMPGDKITMLPPEVVERLTLKAGSRVPALSMYVDVDQTTLALGNIESRVELVEIAANLRHETLEPLFNETAISAGKLDFEYAAELLLLWRLAGKLEDARVAAGASRTQFRDFNFKIDAGRVYISERLRGSPLDKLVSELMILVNSRWGEVLAQRNIAAIYRVQDNSKVRLSLTPGGHQGLGVSHYLWASSPLRRAVDLLNQRQLLALLRGETPAYAPGSEALGTALRDFELAYDAYAGFQRNMERYWCLRYLEQENISRLEASVIRESLVRIDSVPLILRVPSLPSLAPATRVLVTISKIDYLELNCACQFDAVLATEAEQAAAPQQLLS